MTGQGQLPRWPLFLIAAPAAVAIWSGWVGLGGLCGFGPIRPLPGIAGGFTINTAITLPVGVEAYGAYALRAWLTAGVPERAQSFARKSAIGALALGMCGQVIYPGYVVTPPTVAAGTGMRAAISGSNQDPGGVHCPFRAYLVCPRARRAAGIPAMAALPACRGGTGIRQKRAARRCRVCGQVPSRPTDLSMFNSRSVLARALLIASQAVRNWLVWAASVVTSPVATASWLAAITPSRTCTALAGARGSVRRSLPTRRIAWCFSAP